MYCSGREEAGTIHDVGERYLSGGADFTLFYFRYNLKLNRKVYIADMILFLFSSFNNTFFER